MVRVAARRCSACGEDWPTLTEFTNCPLCEGSTHWLNQSVSPYTDEEARRVRNTRQLPGEADPTAGDLLHAHRVGRYRELGFGDVDAELLALAVETERDSTGRVWERPLNWQRVQRALEQGCSHERAVAIFA